MLAGLDFETYGAQNLPTVGLDNYVNDPSFATLLAALVWQTSSGLEEKVFDFVLEPDAKEEFLRYCESPTLDVVAHNASFERAVLGSLGAAHLPVTCTATLSRCAGGASKLEHAAGQFLGASKVDAGSRLVKKFCTGPNPPTAEQVRDDPDWELFKEYCVQDAKLALMLYKEFSQLSDGSGEVLELHLETLTHNMNQRGWPVDVAAVEEMQRRYQENLVTALARFRSEHDPLGELNLNSLPQQKAWCAARGIKATSFDEASVASLIQRIEKQLTKATTLTPEKVQGYTQVLEMLRVKQVLGGSSLKKLEVILNRVGADGRLRDQYLHCGAAQTRRTSGLSVQMQNLKQLSRTPRDMAELFDPDSVWTNDELAENLRQVFTASHPDGFLVVGDFSSVESRGLALLAGAEWKLEEYRKGRDMYKVLAERMFSLDYDSIDKDGPERAGGKVGELSCGYQASAAAVLSFAKAMGIEMTEQQASDLVRDWRRINPETTKLWEDLDALLQLGLSGYVSMFAANDSLRISVFPTKTPESLLRQHPGAQSIQVEIHTVGYGLLVVSRKFHGCYRRGRQICYYKPLAVNGKLWKASYRDPKTGQFRFYDVYGGKLTGILTQSLCREIFFDCLASLERELEDTGVEIVGQFHDEIVVNWDPTKATISLEETVQAMRHWMSDPGVLEKFPLAAEIKYAYRYIK